MSTNLSKYEQIAVNVLKSIFNNTVVNNYLHNYGYFGLYHYILAKLPSGHVLTGFAPKYNLILSNYYMGDVRKKAKHQINHRLLLSSQMLQPTTNYSYHNSVYTILVKLADSKPTKSTQLDKRTERPSLLELQAIHKRFSRQVRRIGAKLLLTDPEFPCNVSKYNHLYYQPHHHNLLLAMPQQAQMLQSKLTKDCYRILGYKPIIANISSIKFNQHKPENTRELITATDDFIDYCLTDYKIQTKDCSQELFKDNQRSKLSYSQRHLAFCCQLRTVKNKPVAQYVRVESKKQVKVNGQLKTKTRFNLPYISNKRVIDLIKFELINRKQISVPKVLANQSKTELDKFQTFLDWNIPIAKVTDQAKTDKRRHYINNYIKYQKLSEELDQVKQSLMKRYNHWVDTNNLVTYRFAKYYWTGLKAEYRLNVAKLLNKPLSSNTRSISQSSKKDATPSVLIGTASGIPP